MVLLGSCVWGLGYHYWGWGPVNYSPCSFFTQLVWASSWHIHLWVIGLLPWQLASPEHKSWSYWTFKKYRHRTGSASLLTHFILWRRSRPTQIQGKGTLGGACLHWRPPKKQSLTLSIYRNILASSLEMYTGWLLIWFIFPYIEILKLSNTVKGRFVIYFTTNLHLWFDIVCIWSVQTS